MGTTRSTPSAPSRSRLAIRSRSPMAPITVSTSPSETWACAPTDSTRLTTEAICSGVASSFMTIIIDVSLLANFSVF